MSEPPKPAVTSPAPSPTRAPSATSSGASYWGRPATSDPTANLIVLSSYLDGTVGETSPGPML
jgi:hypothetical protein